MSRLVKLSSAAIREAMNPSPRPRKRYYLARITPGMLVLAIVIGCLLAWLTQPAQEQLGYQAWLRWGWGR